MADTLSHPLVRYPRDVESVTSDPPVAGRSLRDGVGRAISGVEAVGSLGFAAVELIAPAVIGRPLREDDGRVRALGARDLAIGSLLLVGPVRTWGLAARIGADVHDAVRFRKNRGAAALAASSAVMAVAALLLRQRR